MNPPLWFSVVVAGLSVLKVGLGLAGGLGVLLDRVPEAPESLFVYLVLVLAFTTGAILLLRGRRRDPRALLLGVFFLLVATSFSQGPGSLLTDVQFLSPLASFARSVLPEAFLPFFAWAFFSSFPRVRALEPDSLSWWGRTISLALGVFLFSANLLPALPGFAFLDPLLAPLHRSITLGAYWFLVLGSALPAFVYALGRARRATAEERRRTNLLLFGFVFGSLPVVLLVLLSIMVPPFQQALSRPPRFFLSQIVVYAGLLSIPVTTGYAVLARGALGVRLVLRAAIRYALARRTVTFLTLLPLAGMMAVLFLSREQALATLMVGPSGVALLVAASIGLLGLRFRKAALRSLDERFFREQYDARKILRALVHGVRDVENIDDLGDLLSNEIERALHPRFVLMLTLNPVSRVFEPRRREVPPLPETSMIAGALRGGPTALEVPDFAAREESRLSRMEKHWLRDSDARIIVPLMGGANQLLGFVLLGDRRSELPYSREDKGLLADLAAAVAGTLERRLLPGLKEEVSRGMPKPGDRDTLGVPVEDESTALECERCGHLCPSHLNLCALCGGALGEAPVPLDIRGVYRVECRIGEGGMGLVYRALDRNLHRHVALKTLLRVDPELAARLRHEARAMASVSHPNLATIYGAETWKGRPLILVEYFGAGTLEDRLGKGPMPISEALRLGMALSRGVGHLHELGMLHRDIKPSNIGLSDVREPKLLDFGLVQFLSRKPGEYVEGDRVSEVSATSLEERLDDGSLEQTRPGQFRGTLPYLSPEVLQGARPGPQSDLWSLCVVLFEVIAGENPFLVAGGAARRAAPDLRSIHPECPPEVAEFFSRALSADPSRRPSRSGDLERELRALV